MISAQSLIKQSLCAVHLLKVHQHVHFNIRNSISNWTAPALLPVIYKKSVERKFSSQGNSQAKIYDHENRLEVNIPRWPQALNFSYVWLRDHCHCHKCYDQRTFQRIKDVFEIPINLRPVSVTCTEKELNITWPDGHASKYDFRFLWENTCEGQKHSLKNLSPTTWTKMSFPALELITIPFNEIKKSKEGKVKLVEAILKYGVGFVSEVDANDEATKEAVEALCMVKKTFFGEMFSVKADLKYADTAFSNEFIGAHTDNTYFTEASRIQVFHCLKVAEEGGETLLIDGFNVGKQLQKSDPKSYEFLSSIALPSEYIGDDEHHKCFDVVFKHHPVMKNLIQFRYNIYDRAPLSSLSFEKIQEYYHHLHKLTSIVRRPSNEFWLQLQPGRVLFVDNWRVMHGRSQFRGPRLMGGCYVENSDFTSKARVLGFNVN